LVSGKFAKSSKDSKDSSADLLVFSGSAADVAVLRQVLPLLDVPVRDVLVRATIYEVGDSATVESAINAVGSILGGRVSVDLGVTPSGPVGRISVGGLDAVVGLLDKDSRFRLVSRPVVRVSSGGKSVLSVGSEVPVSGGAVTTSQGQVTQNVVYRPAGVILTVSPTVRQDVISVDVVQVLSDFVRTDTGLNYTPTLNKRELTSSFSVRSGEVTLLAGLTSSRQSGSDQSLLGFSLGKGSSASGSQLLLLLQVELI
jgi:type II secretory pathway component GspD/PulD (secretin)